MTVCMFLKPMTEPTDRFLKVLIDDNKNVLFPIFFGSMNFRLPLTGRAKICPENAVSLPLEGKVAAKAAG